MKDKINWFYAFDKKYDIDSNPYFATISIMLAALFGAMQGAGNTLHEWFDWDLDVNTIVVIGMLLNIYGLNIAESIMASKRASTAISRAVVLFLSLALAWIIGNAVAIFVLLIVALIVGILIIILFGKAGLSMVFGGNGGGEYYYRDDMFGFKHKLHEDMTGDYHDDMGNTFEKVSGKNEMIKK